LVAATIKTANLIAAGQMGGTAAVSPQVAALTEGVLMTMFLTKIKIATGLLLVGLLVIGVAPSGVLHQGQAASNAAFGDRPARDKVTRDAKVKELLKQRLATLKELVKATQAAYVQGKATFAELAQATTLLLKAELELCESDQERFAAHEKALTVAREYEKNAEQLHAAGQATQASVLAARATRLEVEIAYERAKAKIATRAK
jgi:hypothetical protein